MIDLSLQIINLMPVVEESAGNSRVRLGNRRLSRQWILSGIYDSEDEGGNPEEDRDDTKDARAQASSPEPADLAASRLL